MPRGIEKREPLLKGEWRLNETRMPGVVISILPRMGIFLCGFDNPHRMLAARRRRTYTSFMQKKSLFQQNPHLKGNKFYAAALRASVLSSVAIEGVRKVAEKAVMPSTVKTAKT
jgi:hypothetical protein